MMFLFKNLNTSDFITLIFNKSLLEIDFIKFIHLIFKSTQVTSFTPLDENS